MKRFELSINSKFGGNSIVEIKELLKKANKLNLEGIALTDFNDINSFFEIEKEIKNYPNLKYIYGVKINVIYKNMKIKIDMLVKNQDGLKTLYQILTLLNTTKEELDIYKLFDYNYDNGNGLFIGLNITNKEIYELLDSSLDEDIYEFIKVFDYLIVTPFKDHDYIKHMVEISNKYHKFLVASNDVRYLTKEDKKYYELYKQKEVSKYNYLMNTEELYQEFNYLNDVDKDKIIIANPHKISLLIDKIELIENNFYREDKLSILKDIVYKSANVIYNNKIPKNIIERLNEELSLINNKTAYNLLINKKLVEISNDLGYETSTRGGVVSFYINYLLGITKINPLDYNLAYKEFINDINKNVVIGINYDLKVQQALKDYLNKEFNIFRCGTIGKTYEKYLFDKYKGKLTEEEKNKLLGIKRTNGKLPSNYFILQKNKSIEQISPIIDLNDLTTMIDYHYIQNNLIRIFIAQSDQISLYNELNKKLNNPTIDFNDSKVWDSINKNTLKEGITILVRNKVSNIKELAEEWCNEHKTNDWSPNLSYGIEYSIIYYKIAYMKYYNEEIFSESSKKYGY